MILMIDNYDSFTYNLVQYLGEMGQELCVRRNDAVTLAGIRKMKPGRIVISPGPGSPKDAGISKAVIREFGPKVPVLGVCLGHQCIGEVYGGRVVIAGRIMHGKTSLVYHGQDPLFKDVENPFVATRYHSLVIEPGSMPGCLEVIAKTDRGEIMGVRHKEYPVMGVQFHPESILTDAGKQILRNFLDTEF